MEITIHGLDIDKENNDFNTIGDVFDIIEENNSVIMKVIADEKDITNYSNNEIKALYPIDKLEVYAKNTKELINESLSTAEEYLPKLISGIDEIIDKFSKGSDWEGYKMLSESLEGFQWLNSLLMNLKSVDIDEKKLEKFITDWQKNLQKLQNAMENQDLILISDLLEYELLPILKNYLELIQEINDEKK